ncbi:hypothetical protein CAPTEDRAFT_136721 [Capitella teleta]|uniref:SFR19-like C-terminal domain-containing protein n=1 Tax=Capitella teleta TaxID=283909 RepID=R7VM90_CAPTE|nr:hypothetical protein CAPTEDRAFT_136721 [Capitella teleta]|eukprot:ELU18425.1 hypothetical protein CAPTEDRAFT_136721 [Capitella teleta]
MDVSSPLSDEAPAVVFPPAAASAAAAHRNSEPRAPEKGVSFALPSTGEDDTVPSSAVELDNQQKVSCRDASAPPPAPPPPPFHATLSLLHFCLLLQRQQEFMKLNRKERVVEEVKLAIKPYYAKGKINKEQYKEIMRKAVPKICHSRSGDINPNRIRSYIESYVSKIRQAVKYEHKKQEPTSQSQDKAARKPTKQRHSKKPQKAK